MLHAENIRRGNVEQPQLNWIANYIWGIADDVLRDLYVRGKYRDVILPMTVVRRLDTLLLVDLHARKAIEGAPRLQRNGCIGCQEVVAPEIRAR